jgi:hypothetical protein
MPIERNIISAKSAEKIKQAASNAVSKSSEFADLLEGDDLGDYTPEENSEAAPQFNVEEAMDDFLLCFFTLNQEPTDRQMHLLAVALGIQPEELERCVYALFGKIVQGEKEVEVGATDQMEIVDP